MCFDHNHPTPNSSQIHLVFPPTFPPNIVFFFLVFPSRPNCATQTFFGMWLSMGAWLTYSGCTVRENRLFVSWELQTANTHHEQVAGGHFAFNPSLHAGIWSGLVYRDPGHCAPTSDGRSQPTFKVGAHIWKAGLELLQSQQSQGEGRRILCSRLSWAV